MKISTLFTHCAILALAAMPAVALGITYGQVDNFDDGLTEAWTDGQTPANDVNISTGGPAGLGDHYLQLSSGTFGGHTRLITFNDTQWAGNYIAAGVTLIEMDLKNFGSSALPIRIALRSGTGGSATPAYSTTVAFTLPTDGQWHHAIFGLSSSDLTGLHSPTSLSTFLANVPDFRILSSSSPSEVGDALSAQIGIDNITAVPEPAAVILVVAVAGAGLVLRRRKMRVVA